MLRSGRAESSDQGEVQVYLSRRRFLLKSGAVAALTGCSSSLTPKPQTSPVTPEGASQSRMPLIADTAARLNASKAAALRRSGVKTVFRYYSHLPPSLPGKDLQPEEAKVILGEGLSIGSVFQHFNNCFHTFEKKWGKDDAEQALRMAEAAGQPEGSVIYFGVDADWPYQAMRDPIIAYFEDIRHTFERSGLGVGVYSNGCICNAIQEKQLAQYFWLSGSTGHSGTQAFYNRRAWTLFQNALDITPPTIGFAIDTNIANPSCEGYFGQWTDKGSLTASHGNTATKAIFIGRGFLRAQTELKAFAGSAAPTLASIRKDQNVRRLATSDDWVQIETQEGGSRGETVALTGWIPASMLTTLDQFPDHTSNYGLCGSTGSVTDAFKYQNCERATSRMR